MLAPGGCLAVQMPLSYSMPSHVLMRETLADGGVNGSRLGEETLAAAVARKWVLDADEYYELLAPEAESVDVWETEYLQRLEGDDPVLDWVRATGLRPILNRLRGTERERFIEVYRERLRLAYPRRAGRSCAVSVPAAVHCGDAPELTSGVRVGYVPCPGRRGQTRPSDGPDDRAPRKPRPCP